MLVLFLIKMNRPLYTKYQEYIYLHIAVLLFGFTAVLGELIQLSGLNLVWWRMLFTSLSFLIYPKAIKHIGKLDKKVLLQFVGIGVIVAIHWFLFYTSIKVANASVGVVMIATISFFVAIIDPIIRRRSHKKSELLLGLIVIPGIYLINLSGKYDYSQGIWIGLASSFCAALFSVLNKAMVDKTKTPPRTITFIEMTTGFIFLSFFVAKESWTLGHLDNLRPDNLSLIYLVVLAFLCTNLPFSLMLKAQEKLSAFSTNFALNLEPIYGVLLAVLFLHQHKDLDIYFYSGSAIIVSSVLLYSLFQKKQKA